MTERFYGVAGDVVSVRIEHHSRGGWTVSLHDHDDAEIECDTLEDARRVAFLSVRHTAACELLVHDAYHRVVQREMIPPEALRDRRDRAHRRV